MQVTEQIHKANTAANSSKWKLVLNSKLTRISIHTDYATCDACWKVG